MNDEKYNLCVKKISENFSDEVKKLKTKETYSSLEKFMAPFNELSDSEIENVLERQINEKLQLVINVFKEKIKNDEDYRKYYRLLDDMADSFCDTSKDYELLEEAERIADNLVRISTGYKGRKIEHPIKLQYIKEYSIECIYGNDDIRIILYYVLLELSILDYILNNENI